MEHKKNFSTDPYTFQIPKINIVCLCNDKHCEGVLYVAKHIPTSKIYCVCNECIFAYKTFCDVERRKNLIFYEAEKLGSDYNKAFFEVFIPATEEEMITADFPIIKNKVCFCPICENTVYYEIWGESSIPQRKSGWVLAKKDRESGELFCQCENCGFVWETPQDISTTCKIIKKYENKNCINALPTDYKNAGWEIRGFGFLI